MEKALVLCQNLVNTRLPLPVGLEWVYYIYYISKLQDQGTAIEYYCN